MRIPHLQAPFHSALNPYVREADERVIQWVRNLDLATADNWADGYRKAKFTWFAARCFPDADLPQLTLAAAFNVWLFLLDDSCDEVTPGGKYEYIRQLSTELSLVLAGHPPSGNPLVKALADLWVRLKRLAPPDWQAYFLQGMLRYLDACKLEAQWLDMDAWPSLSSYMRYRPYLGAVHLEPALSEVLCGHTLTQADRKTVDQLTLLCCNIVCWSNDLFSLEKEWRNGDKSNLALVLAHERQYDLGEAIRDAAGLHDEDVRQFTGLARETYIPPLARYIRSLEHIVAANMEWSMYDTARYRFTFDEAYSDSLPR
jgi:hypothetical protein